MRRAPEPPAVYAIADAEALAPRTLAEGVEAMASAGIGWIQLRAKRLPDDLFHRAAAECARRLRGAPVRLWIDDRADLAALLPAAGVHLGQRDLPPAAARAALGPDAWIGLSTHDLDQVRAADADPEVDVVAFGPIFATTGKRRPDPVVGLEGLIAARAATGKPLVAIGGIDAARAASVLDAGADAVAAIGAVCRGDLGLNCRSMLESALASARHPRREVPRHG